MYTKCILYCTGKPVRSCGHRKSLARTGCSFVLIEQVPDAERGLPVDLVVYGFLGVSNPPHAFPPIAGNKVLLRLSLPLARGPRLE